MTITEHEYTVPVFYQRRLGPGCVCGHDITITPMALHLPAVPRCERCHPPTEEEARRA